MESMRKRIDLYDTLVKLIILHMSVTLTYRLWPYFLPIRKVLGGIIAVCIITIALKCLKKIELCIIALLLICCGISTVFAQKLGVHFSDVMYFTVTVFFLVKLVDSRFCFLFNRALFYNVKLIKIAIIIVHIIMIIGLAISGCYLVKWGGSYYIGFSEGSHTLGAGLCMNAAFLFYLLKKAKKTNLWTIIYFIPSIEIVMMSGARTFLIPILLIVVIWVLCECKGKRIKLLLIPVLIVTFIVAIASSNLASKFMYSANNTYISSNYVDSLTSGRTIFWKSDIDAFLNSQFTNIIFGHGFDYVYDVNLREVGLYIWAHNDVIDLLLSIGIVGTLLYLILFYRLFKNFYRNILKSKLILLGTIIIYSLGIALINGFFGYQHYLYSFVIFYCALIGCDSRPMIYNQYSGATLEKGVTN